MQRNKQKIPIFVISYNRKWHLERALRSYKKLGNIEIIIHDNGSDDPEVVSYLKKLESEGITINWNKKINNASDLDNINSSIEKYFADKPKTNYIVTDPDIELLLNSQNSLEIYEYILDNFPDVDCVGPMLKIDDISKEYPLYNNVLNRHIEQFWGQKPELIQYKYESIGYIKCIIDTTFSMHRAGERFNRKSKGVRLFGKYSARHLDWYADDGFSSEKYYNESNPKIAHWSNSEFNNKFKNDKLKYSSFYDIERDGKELKIIKRQIK